MRKADFFLHSPFSPTLAVREENKVLLLQFILSDLFSAFHFQKENALDHVFSPESFFYPYDWSLRIGCLNKIQEHSILLAQAFECLKEPLVVFNQALEKEISRCREGSSGDLSLLFIALFPFLESHRHNENLLFFLLKKQKEITEMLPSETCKGLLLKLYPEGLEAIKKLVAENYQKRGFTSVLNEIQFLFKELENTHA